MRGQSPVRMHEHAAGRQCTRQSNNHQDAWPYTSVCSQSLLLWSARRRLGGSGPIRAVRTMAGGNGIQGKRRGRSQWKPDMDMDAPRPGQAQQNAMPTAERTERDEKSNSHDSNASVSVTSASVGGGAQSARQGAYAVGEQDPAATVGDTVASFPFRKGTACRS